MAANWRERTQKEGEEGVVGFGVAAEEGAVEEPGKRRVRRRRGAGGRWPLSEQPAR